MSGIPCILNEPTRKKPSSSPLREEREKPVVHAFDAHPKLEFGGFPSL
jgi:hypothetical protein